MGQQRIVQILLVLVALAVVFQLFLRYQYIHTSGADIVRVDRLTGQSCDMPCDAASAVRASNSSSVIVRWTSAGHGAIVPLSDLPDPFRRIAKIKPSSLPPGYTMASPTPDIYTCGKHVIVLVEDDLSNYTILALSSGAASKGDHLSGNFGGFYSVRTLHDLSTGADSTAFPVYHSDNLDGVQAAMGRLGCSFDPLDL